jgi:DNA-binding transcriptional ArsR family regulator
MASPSPAPEVFVIARSPRSDARLPILLRVPLPAGAIVLATREPWPVRKDLFCAELTAWPEDAEVIERVPVASCRRVGASVQLVLDRPQRRRSLFVWVKKGASTLVFWRSERSMRAVRPGVRTPTARGLDGPLTIVVDERERYPWRFASHQVTLERRRLPAGDYAVFEQAMLVAVVERKRLDEFAGAAVSGSLQLAMAELATLPRAAVVVEGRLTQLLKSDVPVQPGWLLNLVAALQAAYPNVPILFAETGPLAADLAYRWLAACLRLGRDARAGRSISEVIKEALGPRAAALTVPAPTEPSETPLFAAPPAPRAVAHGDTQADRVTRQRAALERARAGEALSVAEHAARHGVHPATASADLRALERAGLLRSQGRARSLRFFAAEG